MPISRRRSRTAASRAFVIPSDAMARAMTPIPVRTISTTWT